MCRVSGQLPSYWRMRTILAVLLVSRRERIMLPPCRSASATRPLLPGALRNTQLSARECVSEPAYDRGRNGRAVIDVDSEVSGLPGIPGRVVSSAEGVASVEAGTSPPHVAHLLFVRGASIA